MTELTPSDKVTNLIEQANTLEKFLLFMVTGLTVAVIVLAVQLSNVGDSGSSGSSGSSSGSDGCGRNHSHLIGSYDGEERNTFTSPAQRC